MTDSEDFLTEAEATRLWQKAAQLQADAARRADALGAGVTPSNSSGGRSGSDAAEGYALVHVRAAATEAGIGDEFIETALTELRAERALGAPDGKDGLGFSRAILGHPPGVAEARRVVRAEPAAVLAAMEAILPHEPYALLLHDRVGDPLHGGTLIFDIQGVGFFTVGTPGFKTDAGFADLRQVFVTLAPAPGDRSRTEVTIRSPVTWALRLNALISGMLTTMGGVAGFAVGVGVGAVLLSLGPVGTGLLAALGTGGSGSLSLFGMRKLYRYGLARGSKTLEALLATVAAQAEGGWGIAPASGQRSTPM